MKRLLSCILGAALVLTPVQAAQDQPDLELSAAAAVLMEKETGTLLYESQAHKALEPASVTKVMTMLLVMEAIDSGAISKDDMVTVSEAAAGMGGSQVYLEPGEQMSVSELLKCVAVVSGNDAAVALAEHLCGSEGAFVQRMNTRAQELGMKDTKFLNCTGLPQEGHVTSAYDIALMSRELILHHPDIRQYTTIWMDSIRDGSFGLSNTNRLVRFYQGATGLKTGSTDSALYCLSATAERDGMELIAVVLGAPTSSQRFQDAQTLLDYGFAGWTLCRPQPEQALPPVPVLLGEQRQVQPVASETGPLLIRREEAGQVTTELSLSSDVEAPVEEGQILGRMTVYVAGEERCSVPLVASQGVARLTTPGLFLRMVRQLLLAS